MDKSKRTYEDIRRTLQAPFMDMELKVVDTLTNEGDVKKLVYVRNVNSKIKRIIDAFNGLVDFHFDNKIKPLGESLSSDKRSKTMYFLVESSVTIICYSADENGYPHTAAREVSASSASVVHGTAYRNADGVFGNINLAEQIASVQSMAVANASKYLEVGLYLYFDNDENKDDKE